MWRHTLVYFCAIIISVAQSNTDDELQSRLVKITQGAVRGYKDPQGSIFVFYGIPYATAPTGPSRFKAPYPPPVWLQPLDAIDKGIVCPQTSSPYINLENKTIQEDCLIANIYVPDTEEQNLPVVVFVHGGAFQIGFGDLMSPKSFSKEKKIIAVTFNYRLGVNGFLCLGTKDVPGNAGLKDQVALLRWVQKNIEAFGGNPQDVTVAGCSAGSVSVDLLMLSKSTKGLFNKVIPESGANVGAIAIQPDPLETAKNYAKAINFTNVGDFYALEEFYRTASIDLLTRYDTFTNSIDSSLAFTPCVERETGEEFFLTDSPINILKKGEYRKMPMLYGFTNMEGLMRIGFFDLWKNKMNEKFSDFLPADLKFANDDEKEEVAKKVKEFYFGDKPVGEETVLAYIDYFTDVLFAYSTLRSVKLHVAAGNDRVYLYEYSYVDDSIPPIPHTNVRGAPHCAQTAAVLYGQLSMRAAENNILEDENQDNTKTIMREMWYNFITTSKPVPEGSKLPAWPTAGADRAPHMSLGATVQLKGPLLQHRALFWDDIYQRYYRDPLPPPTPPARPHSEL